MKKIEIKIPKGKKAMLTKGTLTFIDELKKYYKFKVGDKALLNEDTIFFQGNGGVCLINVGAEVEIVSVSDNADATEKIYKIKHRNSTATVFGCVLDKIEFKFNIGDRVTLVGSPLAVFTIVSQIIKDGEPYYGVEGRPNCLPYRESELMPYGNKKVEYKFKLGDKVTFKNSEEPYTITDRFIAGKDCPAYKLDDCENVEEDKIELYVPQDITERIKTFNDALQWCRNNGKEYIVEPWDNHNSYEAYLKLCIIVTALNEGWEPTFEVGEQRWYPYVNEGDSCISICNSDGVISLTESNQLLFKNATLAKYAANQFADIYVDYCGCKEGGN